MKRLIMCEGANELEIMRILLSFDCLVFGENELLGLTPYHARQLSKNAMVRTELNMYPKNDILIMRIGDKQNEKLKIPAEYRGKILGVEKYCTKPELEILLIIAEEMEHEYEKVKSRISPKEFAKKNITCGKYKYDNSSMFYKTYFADDCEKLISAIKEYKRTHKHLKDELYSADILKF